MYEDPAGYKGLATRVSQEMLQEIGVAAHMQVPKK